MNIGQRIAAARGANQKVQKFKAGLGQVKQAHTIDYAMKNPNSLSGRILKNTVEANATSTGQQHMPGMSPGEQASLNPWNKQAMAERVLGQAKKR